MGRRKPTVTEQVQAAEVGRRAIAREQSERVRRVSVGTVGAWNPGCLCELQPLWQNTNPTDWTTGYGVQFVSHTGKFLHLNIPIINGESLLLPLLDGVNLHEENLREAA